MRSSAMLRAAGALALVTALLSLLPMSTAGATRPSDPASDAWSSGTRTLTRTYFPSGGTEPFTVTNHVAVRVDKHTDLQSRERIRVSWSGAVPTGGLQGNPYGSTGLNQEYPVAIMECRGTAATVRPDSCWTTTSFERSYSTDATAAPWLDDRYNTAADSAAVSGIDPKSVPSSCGTVDPDFAYHFTPFVGATGKTYVGCDVSHMPPEAAVGSVDPPNEIFGQTKPDGTGSANVEVRTDTENASLGCSHRVACSLVVVPIMGLSCKDPGGLCNAGPFYFPGEQYDGTDSPQLALSGYLWWSPSNWRNRIVVPLEFGLPPNTCQLLNHSTPVPFYGSELLSQAALQWAPAFCLNKKRFNWQSNTMPDDAALALAGNGGAIAAEVAGDPTSGQDLAASSFAYAPTAVTGFGIAFDVDDPTSGEPLTSLKLDARLLAKLLTESYPATVIGAKHPGLEHNPLTLESDPEFLRLNPTFHPRPGGAAPISASTLLALSNGSLVIRQLTSYIASDPSAMAFINGKPDQWGMRVNPAYKHLKLPVTTWPLLDTWKPSRTGQECLDANPMVYLQNIAAPVSSMRLISTAMLFNWPNVQTTCEKDVTTGLWKIGRTTVQSYGQRFMLGLVNLGDAARYGLPMASLQTRGGNYVKPTNASMAAAVRMAKQPKPLQAFEFDEPTLRKSRSAYPGTMVVYTAARIHGLAKDDAAKVAQFIDVSITHGQVPGRGNGKLPDGYLPITKKGATGRLYAAALDAAEAIASQKGDQHSSSPSATPTPSPSSTESAPTVPNEPSPGAVPSAPPGVPSPSVSNAATTAAPTDIPTASGQPLVPTSAVNLPFGGGLLPILMFIGVGAGLVTALVRIVLRVKGLR